MFSSSWLKDCLLSSPYSIPPHCIIIATYGCPLLLDVAMYHLSPNCGRSWMSQAPFLAKKLNHESNPIKNDVFIKFKCFCQNNNNNINKRNNIGCYLCLLLRSSVFLHDIPKNYVSPQPEKRIYFKKYL